MTTMTLTKAQADALRWVAADGTVATPRSDVLTRLMHAALVTVVPGRMVNGRPSNLDLTDAGRTALAEADAVAAAPFRIRRTARWARRPTAMTMIDSIGVAIEVGDRVIVNAWGAPVRLIDVGQRGTVIGFARTRVIVDWDTTGDAPVRNIPFGHLGVLRRDGAPGFEGNARRGQS